MIQGVSFVSMHRLCLFLLIIFSSQCLASEQLGPVTAKDNLWRLARHVIHKYPNENTTIQQVMLALVDKNPKAFVSGNINGLMKGAKLLVPTDKDTFAISSRDALLEVSQQNESWHIAKIEKALNSDQLSGFLHSSLESSEHDIDAIKTESTWSFAVEQQAQESKIGLDTVETAAVDEEVIPIRFPVTNYPNPLVDDQADDIATLDVSIDDDQLLSVATILEAAETDGAPVEDEPLLIEEVAILEDITKQDGHDDVIDWSELSIETSMAEDMLALQDENNDSISWSELSSETATSDDILVSQDEHNDPFNWPELSVKGVSSPTQQLASVDLSDFVFTGSSNTPANTQWVESTSVQISPWVSYVTWSFFAFVALLTIIYSQSISRTKNKNYQSSLNVASERHAELSSEDDFFLHQVEAGESMLDLARAYIKMENYVQAKKLIHRIIAQNNDALTKQAKELLLEIRKS